MWDNSKLKVGAERKVGILSKMVCVNRISLKNVVHHFSEFP